MDVAVIAPLCCGEIENRCRRIEIGSAAKETDGVHIATEINGKGFRIYLIGSGK